MGVRKRLHECQRVCDRENIAVQLPGRCDSDLGCGSCSFERPWTVQGAARAMLLPADPCVALPLRAATRAQTMRGAAEMVQRPGCRLQEVLTTCSTTGSAPVWATFTSAQPCKGSMLGHAWPACSFIESKRIRPHVPPVAPTGTVHMSANSAVPDSGATISMLLDRSTSARMSSDHPTTACTSPTVMARTWSRLLNSRTCTWPHACVFRFCCLTHSVWYTCSNCRCPGF